MTRRSAREKTDRRVPDPSVVYACPMHPAIQLDHPGICPECGMNLVKSEPSSRAQVEGKLKLKSENNGGQSAPMDKHEGHTPNVFAKKFWVSLFLTIPVVLYSELPEKLFSVRMPAFTGVGAMTFIASSIVFFYGGWVFIASAYREIRGKLPGMMTLISLAIITAYAFSVWGTVVGVQHTLYWELTTLISVMLLGHWLEMRAVQGAQGALRTLSKLLPDVAEKMVYGSTTEILTVPISALNIADLVLVRPGSKVPADGVVTEGSSEVNESMITGESKPVQKTSGNDVIAGTTNGSGSLVIKVTKIGEKTFLAGVMRLVREAQSSKSKLQLLSDKAALYLTFVAIAIGGLAFIVWMVLADPITAVERLVAVLVITCPHALGLAIPLVASISTTMAAKEGLLIKRRLALEAARDIDVVLFDKTGTLTKGEYGVEKVISNDAFHTTHSTLIQMAASVDVHSEHVVAKAIVDYARSKRISIDPVKEFTALPGKGARGVVKGTTVVIGGANLVEELRIDIPLRVQQEIDIESSRGKTIVYVLSDKNLLGVFVLADIIRVESRKAIRDLQRLGMKVSMITGDSEDVAKFVAKKLSIDEYFSRVLPGEKSKQVKELQRKGLKVAMVGDGINDAAALEQADVGIAIGAGTNVAIESAGIILVKNDPRDIVKIITLSRLTYSKMVQNLFWATGYNVIALPLAAGVLAPLGILLQPAISALLMSVSTVVVAFNAVLLRKSRL